MNYVTTKITVTNCKTKRKPEQERKTPYLLVEVQSKRQQDRQEHTPSIEKHKANGKNRYPLTEGMWRRKTSRRRKPQQWAITAASIDQIAEQRLPSRRIYKKNGPNYYHTQRKTL